MLEVRLLYKRIENDKRALEHTVLERTTELRDSEARFRSLVELVSDWYWEQDEKGVFTKVSGPALEMLGLGDGDGKEGGSPPRWNQEERAMLDEKLASRKPFLDFVHSRIHADGTEQFLQTSGEPRFDASGRFIGYRGIGMDVTARMGAGRGNHALAHAQLRRVDGSLLSMYVQQKASGTDAGWVFVEVIPDPEQRG
jgi:PAS domain S-box-containing protein